MLLRLDSLKDVAAWRDIALPRHDIPAMRACTAREPVWVHFGTGNIFRGFIASLQQTLLNKGLPSDKGIIAAETFDYDIIDKIFVPHDNLALNVTLKADGGMDCEIVASVAEALRADTQAARLYEVFKSPSLQMASFTITEKGYAPLPGSAMSTATDLLYTRYHAGAYPIAMVSMDNCSQNGDWLKNCVMELAKSKNDAGFTDWLGSGKVSFPWSMIDKITPRPAQAVRDMLESRGIEGMTPIVTSKNTFIAAFVNAERPQYLVIEDVFPNGRPPLEQAGVIFTDRETVEKTERMKVTTCLNPLHTALAVFGCLLGYTLISEEMKDPDLTALVRRLGYDEGLPVVTDPGIISPRAFIDEVMNERLPNPFMPDAPQRIATDTSQKVGIRFGETIKSYMKNGRSVDSLVAIPLVIAGWLRYLRATDDNGNPMEISPDPLKDKLQSMTPQEILAERAIFGLNLTETNLADRIMGYYESMLKGAGAVRETLRTALAG